MAVNEEINLLPDQPLGEKLLKKWFWLYFFSYLAAPCGYFIKLIVSNTLSVADVGVLYSIIWFISILSAYNGLWLTESLNYFLPKFYIKKQWNYIKTSIWMSLGVQMVTSIWIILFLFFGAEWFAINYFQSPDSVLILKYLCFYFLGVNLFQVIIWVFNAFQDTFNAKLLDFVKIFSVLVFTVLFFVFGIGNLMQYTIAWIGGMFVGLAIWILIFTKKYRKILLKWDIIRETKFLKKYWKYSLWTFVSLNVVLVLTQIDQQMVIVMLGPDAAGYYTNFLSLRQILMLLITPIMVFIFPLFTEMIEKKSNKDVLILQNFLYTYISFFSIGISLFLIVLWPEIATIFFGQKFLYSGQLMILGGWFLIFNILSYLNFQMLAAMWVVRKRTKILGVAVLTNFILNFILLKKIWLWGAIIGTAVAMIIIFVWSYGIIKKIYPVKVDWKFLVRNILFFLVLTCVIYYFKDNIFVLEDTFRYRNIWYLIIVGLIFVVIVFWLNYKKVIWLKKIVLNMRNKKIE